MRCGGCVCLFYAVLQNWHDAASRATRDGGAVFLPCHRDFFPSCLHTSKRSYLGPLVALCGTTTEEVQDINRAFLYILVPTSGHLCWPHVSVVAQRRSILAMSEPKAGAYGVPPPHSLDVKTLNT